MAYHYSCSSLNIIILHCFKRSSITLSLYKPYLMLSNTLYQILNKQTVKKLLFSPLRSPKKVNYEFKLLLV